MCQMICKGADAGICNGAPSTCSNDTITVDIHCNFFIRLFTMRRLWISDGLTHFILNRLSHTIYWKSPISIFRYARLYNVNILEETG